MINRDKLVHILEYAKQQRHIGQHCKIPPDDMVEIVEMAMLHGADGTLTNEGTNHPEDNLDMVDHSGDANEKANSPVIPDGWVNSA